MLRKIIVSLVGILMVFGSIFWSRSMVSNNEAPKTKQEKSVTAVITQKVLNTSTPISITTSGNLSAKKRIELFAEVQGVFEPTGRDFLPGEQYKSGATLIKINSDEHSANIRSLKSNLYNQLVNLLPDLRLDYPDAFPKWETYVSQFDVEADLKDLPEPSSEKEKLFIAGKNIFTTFYNIKNLEERLLKYTISAPFYGVLTEADVRHGTVVRAGQKLGTFISPNVYELEVNINESYSDLMKIGSSVNLRNIAKTKSWQGTVSRVNATVDPNSQSIQVFIQVSGQGLREGMYLEASVTAKEEENTYELDRKLLVDNSKIFAVKDSTLQLMDVDPVYFKESTVVVRGLADGTDILKNAVPGAYQGMKVKIIEE